MYYDTLIPLIDALCTSLKFRAEKISKLTRSIKIKHAQENQKYAKYNDAHICLSLLFHHHSIVHEMKQIPLIYS